MVGVASRRTRGQTSSQRTVIAQVGGFQLEPLAALSQLPSRAVSEVCMCPGSSREVSRSACAAARRLCPPSRASSLR